MSRTERGGRPVPSTRPEKAERSEGTQSLGAILDELARTGPLAAGTAIGELARRWSEVVGERLARESSPTRLAGEVLFVSVSSAAWGAQLTFLAKELARQANQVLGERRIRSVKVVVRSGAPD